MAKSIGLKQLAQKVYEPIPNLPAEIVASLGDVETAFDAIIYGASGNGKTNFTVQLLKDLLLALPAERAEYISFEEGHGKSVYDCMITRHDMLNAVGSRLIITDHLSITEVEKKIGKRKSPKIWVIDSLQASGFTFEDCKRLKEKFVLTRKKKILLFISWSEGKTPKGSVAKAVEYYANIKMFVDRLVVFPKSRYGGNLPYVIYEPGARAKWGKDFAKIVKPLNEFLKRNDKKSNDVRKAKTEKRGSDPEPDGGSKTTRSKAKPEQDPAPVLLVPGMPSIPSNVEQN